MRVLPPAGPPLGGARPDDGAFVGGVRLVGARWDADEGALADSRPRELIAPLPVLHLLPVRTVATGGGGAAAEGGGGDRTVYLPAVQDERPRGDARHGAAATRIARARRGVGGEGGHRRAACGRVGGVRATEGRATHVGVS